MDRAAHARFLEYRERFTYFGRGGAVRLDAAAFEAADKEHRELVAKGDARDDEEMARFEELSTLLHRD
jgi:hypothetical protein